MRRVPGSNHFFPRPITDKGRVSTEMFFFILHEGRDGPPFQNSVKLADIMTVRSGYDDGQRDTTTVYEQMAFAAFFSPGPWDLPQHSRAPTELCSCLRQLPAIAKQCPPSHHIRKVHAAKVLEKTHGVPIRGNSDVLHSDSRRLLSARLSTVSRYVTHTLSPQKQYGVQWAFFRLRPCVYIPFLAAFPAWVSKVQLWPQICPTLPRIVSSLLLSVGEKHTRQSRKCLVIYG